MPEPCPVGPVPLEVFDRIGVIVDVQVLQNPVEFEACQAEELGSLIVGQFLGPVVFDYQRFECLAARIGMAGNATVIRMRRITPLDKTAYPLQIEDLRRAPEGKQRQ